ncbi:hypothetical protein MRX96_031574 [Rhipicephalus microplus]
MKHNMPTGPLHWRFWIARIDRLARPRSLARMSFIKQRRQWGRLRRGARTEQQQAQPPGQHRPLWERRRYWEVRLIWTADRKVPKYAPGPFRSVDTRARTDVADAPADSPSQSRELDQPLIHSRCVHPSPANELAEESRG